MENIAIIPARSGSKGITDKNIKVLFSKPLIAYSIEAAKRSANFCTVMVSTDSERYAQIARQYGAEVPFLRSERMSTDAATSWDAVEEVLSGYEERGQTFDTFCLLQPTSPLRTPDDIINAYELFYKKNAFSVVSITELEHPVSWCGTLGTDRSLNGFIAREQNRRRQDMAKDYRPNGAIFIANIEEFRKDHFLYRDRSYGYIMPKERSVDIDTDLDFEFAEFLMSRDGSWY